MQSLLRTNKEITEIYERNVDTVYRIAYTYMKNEADTKDIVQETFLRLIRSNQVFENLNHEKAWLIVTTSNLCKDNLKHWWRKREDIEEHTELMADEKPDDTVLKAVLSLPEKYRFIICLYYYEGYNSLEIASILHKPNSTIRTQLVAARKQLKTILGGDEYVEQTGT